MERNDLIQIIQEKTDEIIAFLDILSPRAPFEVSVAKAKYERAFRSIDRISSCDIVHPAVLRQLKRSDLPKKVMSENGLHKPAYLNGEKVFICDIHHTDDTLCYLENANGIPTKISDLQIV